MRISDWSSDVCSSDLWPRTTSYRWRRCAIGTRRGCRNTWPPAPDRGRSGGDQRRDLMAMDAGEIERLIKSALPDARITIEDLRGDSGHYACPFVLAAFPGKHRVQQHQPVSKKIQWRHGTYLNSLVLHMTAPWRRH